MGRPLYFAAVVTVFLFFSPILSGWKLSSILPHTMWPWCEFRMQVSNVLHAARWKYRTQKDPQKLAICVPSHILSGYIFATKAYINNREKFVKQQYLLHLFPLYDELRPTNGWQRFASLRHPSKFQRVSRLAFVTAATSLTGGQPNFARCLTVSWAGTLLNFCGILLPNGILPGAKFTLRPTLAFSIYWQRYCTALE